MTRRQVKHLILPTLVFILVAIPLLRLAYATIKPPGAIAMPSEQKIFVNDYAYLDGSGSCDPQG